MAAPSTSHATSAAAEPAEPASGRIVVEVWSDVVCPFCWIGKRRLEAAVRELEMEDEVEVRFRAFELDPRRTGVRPLPEYLAQRFGPNAMAMTRRVQEMGAPEGLAFDFQGALSASSFDAHRLVLFAQDGGLGAPALDRLMRAHFAEGADVSDRATLRRLAVEAGLEGQAVDGLFAGDAYAARVREDEAAAHRAGVRGVPFFVLDGKYALSGAQPVDLFKKALGTVRDERGR